MTNISATAAQARRLAQLFGAGEKVRVSKYTTPTDMVLIKRCWISPTGATGKFLSGEAYALFEINEAGMGALSDFLIKQRIDKRAAELAHGTKPAHGRP